MPKQQRDGKTTKPLKRYIPVIYLLLIIGLVFYLFLNEYERRSSIKNNPKKFIKAIVTNEKVYSGNSPVSNSFTYKYKFAVDGKQYSGISYDENLRPGDTIEVEYVADNPNNNVPKSYYSD